jgi:FkbM family methyltransferase
VAELFERFVRVGDELAITTRRTFLSDEIYELATRVHPEEAFEWMALLDALADARDRMTMLELGAGYGRWTVRAALATRVYRPELTYRLLAVEAEPTRFGWLELHLADNGVARSSAEGSCELVNAAVSRQVGYEDFYVGDSAAWYGQALVRPENAGAQAAIELVRTVTLGDLLGPLDHVDLIDLDIQGAELEVLREAAPALGHVRRVYVETHSHEIDDRLPHVFAEAAGAWSAVAIVPLGARRATPLGEASFDGGGMQLWLNDARSERSAGPRHKRKV